MRTSVYALLRALAVQLRDRAAALDDHTPPPELRYSTAAAKTPR